MTPELDHRPPRCWLAGRHATIESSVGFYKSEWDSKAGYQGDDIYTNASGAAGGMPGNAKDTSITPGTSRP